MADAPERTTPRRAIVLVDGGVADAWPDLFGRVEAYFARQAGMPELRCIERTTAGEAAKQTPQVAHRVVELVNQHGIDRQSYVVSIGGGAVQDAVGYGASVAHRGCRVVRIATTTLAQDDAAMAVKCGINTGGKKNFTGTFSVPWGVVCDQMFLSTLPRWSWCGGFSEAVKIALLKDARLFSSIERDAPRICARDMGVAMPIIVRSAELHYQHIVLGGDPFETQSARPLDFGHWVAHRLEGLTQGSLPHGQAVAVGVALDSLYSACAGMLPMDDALRVVHTLRALELPTTHQLLSKLESVSRGLEEFREHLGGRLTITLLRGIGQAVDVHELRPDLLARAVELSARAN
jgi:3-dehydroquinate synthase